VLTPLVCAAKFDIELCLMDDVDFAYDSRSGYVLGDVSENEVVLVYIRVMLARMLDKAGVPRRGTR
jgi:hypothetical protein